LADCSPESILAEMQGTHALLVRTKAHITARIIDAAPELMVIGRASPSIDHIDLRAIKRRQISIVYCPHLAVNSIAQFALGMILCLQRRIGYLDRQVRDGKFDVLRTPAGRELGRQTLGLFGVDPVAASLARICVNAFGMPVLYHDPFEGCHAASESTGASARIDMPGESVDLDRLLKESDILSVHLTGPRDGKPHLDAKSFSRMKPTAVLINASRGTAIHTVDLAQALRRRTIAGAALDVFEVEPLRPIIRSVNRPIASSPRTWLGRPLTPTVNASTSSRTSPGSSAANLRVSVFEVPDGTSKGPD